MIASGKITAEQAKLGYVGAFPYAEVISGYTAFYLGAKSVCPTVTMDVTFVNSWYNEPAEKEAAEYLIEVSGCVLISQHGDSIGVPRACENLGTPNISYNINTTQSCPNTSIMSLKIDWTPYFKYICTSIINGENIATDWTGNLATGSVVISEVNEKVAANNTANILETVKAELIAETRHVFDTSNFTVNNEILNSYLANVDWDSSHTPETQVIADGIFMESYFRSAPYFDILIDGIYLVH